MKILVITDLYPVSENEVKTPKTIYNFVQSWKNQGHEVKILKPNFLLNSFLRQKPYYKNGIYGDVENVNYFLPFIGNLKNKIQTDLSADIIIAHMPSGIITANKLGLKFAAAVHCSDLEVLKNPIYSIYFKNELLKAYKNATKIACRSNVLYKEFLNKFPCYKEKTFVAYSGIEESIITKKNWENKKHYKVLTCANLIKRKNIDKVIEACSNIDNIELTVIGDGTEKNKLKSMSDKVTFTGQIPHKSVINYMKDADIFILPSEHETFGLVYLEAMASGCITVGLKNDGIDGIIIDNYNGFLCDKFNIKDTIINIINSNNQNQILENCYKTILDYTNEKAAKNYLDNIISV